MQRIWGSFFFLIEAEMKSRRTLNFKRARRLAIV